MPGPKYLEGLYEIAAERDGYFTIPEARKAGVDPQRVRQLAHRGKLEHVSQGVYRLINYPTPLERGQLWEMVLWPQQREDDPIGTLSHRTALDLHNVSDINPSVIDVTVPASKRIRRNLPQLMQLHSVKLDSGDVEFIDGLPVTGLMRTFEDCISEGIALRFVREGAENALRLGRITPVDHDRILGALHARVA